MVLRKPFYGVLKSKHPEIRCAPQAKYVEISNVCSDFVETAKHLATTIIDERNIAMTARTIQPAIEGDCHGRGVEGNRGQAGKTYKYEAFNIRLKVCCDDHGLFNGDDECAAKGYGGRELLGALEYMKQHQPGEFDERDEEHRSVNTICIQ